MCLGLEGQISTEKLTTEKNKDKILQTSPPKCGQPRSCNAQGETEEAVWKLLLQYSDIINFAYCLQLLMHHRADWSSCDRDHMAHTV